MAHVLTNPIDGREPAYRALASGEQPSSGEVAVEDVPPGSVWDAKASRLRPQTDAEKLAKRREEAAGHEGLASAAAVLRSSANPDTRALVAVLERAGVL